MQGCLICGDTRLTNIIYHPEFAFRIRRCSACSFVQTDFISDDKLQRFYADKYMPTQDSFDFEHWSSIRSPQSDAQIKFIGEFVEITPSIRTLDYGAATGELVAAFRQCTEHAFALEIDQKFQPRLATIAATVLDDAALGQAQYDAFFDIITISHVLEHVWDPYQTVTALFNALKPGGWLFVEVPAEAEVLQQTHTAGSGHLWFFEPETIKAFFAVHGMFDLVALRRDGLSIAEYISGLKQGRQAQPRQDLTNTVDGGSLRLMLRRPLVPHDGPTRSRRLLDWRDIAEAHAEQISDMFKLILQYHNKLQIARQEVERLKKGKL